MSENNHEKDLNSKDSLVSMALGVAVILVAGLVAFNYFSKKTPSTSSNQEMGAQGSPSTQLPTTYVVKEGDTLWSISEMHYKTGFNWKDIAEANDITDSMDLPVGKSINIPVVTPIMPIGSVGEIASGISTTSSAIAEVIPTKAVEQPTETPTVAPSSTTAPTMAPTVVPTTAPSVPSTEKGATPSGKTYTVVHGDSLWKIALSLYNDGYKWSEIAKLNNLENPDIIHAGNVLKLP